MGTLHYEYDLSSFHCDAPLSHNHRESCHTVGMTSNGVNDALR